MTPKKIAIYIDSLSGGGAERVMLSLSSQMQQEGHEVHFFLLEKVIDYVLPEQLNVHVLNQPHRRTKATGIFHIKRTANAMVHLVNDIENKIGPFDLHLSNLDSTNQVLHHCDFKNTYYVVHNSIKQELKRAAKLNTLRYLRTKREKAVLNGKKLIAVSKGVAQEAQSIHWLKPESVTTIYNPCNINEIRSLAEQPNHDIPSEPYLLHIGRVVRQKRHDILFKAIKQVPNIKLVLLCKNIKKVKKLARHHGVEDRIITPSFQHNPYNWMKKASLMTFSSEFEGLGMVLIESLICGTPVVSTDCDFGPSEILTGPMADYLVPINDPDALAVAIIKALNDNIDVSEAPIINEVDLPKVTQQYLALVESL